MEAKRRNKKKKLGEVNFGIHFHCSEKTSLTLVQWTTRHQRFLEGHFHLCQETFFLSFEDKTEETVGQSSNIFVLCKINNPVKYMLKFVLCQFLLLLKLLVLRFSLVFTGKQLSIASLLQLTSVLNGDLSATRLLCRLRGSVTPVGAAAAFLFLNSQSIYFNTQIIDTNEMLYIYLENSL